MTEDFFMEAFRAVGAKPEGIKIFKKFGFGEFRDVQLATKWLHKLNGKIIPNRKKVSKCAVLSYLHIVYIIKLPFLTLCSPWAAINFFLDKRKDVEPVRESAPPKTKKTSACSQTS
jgi:hypothetical protein